jgi:hypothetical protein
MGCDLFLMMIFNFHKWICVTQNTHFLQPMNIEKRERERERERRERELRRQGVRL